MIQHSKPFVLFLFQVIQMIIWPVCVGAQPSLRISGKILDAADSTPVGLARIKLVSLDTVQQTYSRRDGSFQFSGLKAGEWNVLVHRFGYYSYRQWVSVRKDTSLKIVLQPAPIQMPEIVIQSGSRDVYREMHSSVQAVSVLPLETVKAVNAVDIGDVLSYVPGVMIKDYGGMGGLKTISLRGSTASQVMVLVDGVRFDDFQTGTTDLSLLNLSDFSEIRVYRGGGAARFGASALYGAVNLSLHGTGAWPLFTVATGAGSYGWQSHRAAASLKKAGWQVYSAFTQEMARGDHLYRFREFGNPETRRRKNGDFHQTSAVLSLSRPQPFSDSRLSLFYTGSKRGVPGPVLQGREGTLFARQEDRDLFLLLSHRRQLSAGTVLKSWGRYHYRRLRYRDPDIPIQPGGLDARYTNHDALLGVEWRRTARTGYWQIRWEMQRAVLIGNNLAVPGENGYRRTPRVGRTSTQFAVFWETIPGSPESAAGASKIEAGIRLSWFSDIGTALSPFVGVNYPLWHWPLKLRAYLAHNFRVPTFAEQYYLNFGNRNIRPEQGYTLEIGANLWRRRQLMADVAFFAMFTSDQIIAIPRSPVMWSTANVGRARTLGVEIQLNWKPFGEKFAMHATYTRQEPRDATPGSRSKGKLLIYTPQEMATLILNSRWPLGSRIVLRTAVNLRRISHRYHLPENDYDSLMAPYTVLDGNITVTFALHRVEWELRFETDNLTATGYEVIRNYPMPLRLWRLGLQLTWKPQSQ